MILPIRHLQFCLNIGSARRFDSKPYTDLTHLITSRIHGPCTYTSYPYVMLHATTTRYIQGNNPSDIRPVSRRWSLRSDPNILLILPILLTHLKLLILLVLPILSTLLTETRPQQFYGQDTTCLFRVSSSRQPSKSMRWPRNPFSPCFRLPRHCIRDDWKLSQLAKIR